MEKTTTRVLKAEEVKMQGQIQLDLAQPLSNAAAARKVISPSPQVRIVENNADYAVIEVTCKCGTKTMVRCDYNDTKTA